MFVTVFNTTTSPITVDPEGRQIGGRDWGTVNTTQELVKPYLPPDGDGSLVQVEVSATDAGHPDAIAAAQRTEAVSGRASELQGVDKDLLTKAAEGAGVSGAADLTKPELVHALANRPDVEIPESEQDEERDTAELPGDDAAQPAEPVTESKSRRR